MIRCLCCNKEITKPDEYESAVFWHKKCVRSFFHANMIPELDLSESELERLADLTVNKGLTVPGVQKKLSLHLETVDKTPRLTIVDHPAGYILKPQSGEYDYLPEAEFLTMKMAGAAGIKTVPNALVYSDGLYSYITRRIDRENDSMYAMEDFCQLSERMTADKYRSSYENCGKVIKKYSKNTGLDLAEFYYRLLFCFLTGNSDMHLKNFSLIESTPGSRIYSLSAAYDMLPVNIIMPADKEQMALTLNGKKRNIKKNDFLKLAENLGISEKTAGGLIIRILKYKPKFIEMVSVSYISGNMKSEMTKLMEKRAAALE